MATAPNTRFTVGTVEKRVKGLFHEDQEAHVKVAVDDEGPWLAINAGSMNSASVRLTAAECISLGRTLIRAGEKTSEAIELARNANDQHRTINDHYDEQLQSLLGESGK